jgi:Rieske Fe-S protein
MNPTRRDFLKTGGSVVVCTCTGAGASACAAIAGTSNMAVVPPEAFRSTGSKVVIDLSNVPALGVTGGAAKLEIAGTHKKICVVRAGDDNFAAFVNRCAHLGRELEYRDDDKRLRCASIGHSEYDLDGRSVKGPAKGNLTKLAVSRNGDFLEIAL